MTELPKITQYRLEWTNDKGQPHRDGDLPAVIDADGTVFYWQDGKLHRDGGEPAVVWSEKWYQNDNRYKHE
jgi:hypothetical protein